MKSYWEVDIRFWETREAEKDNIIPRLLLVMPLLVGTAIVTVIVAAFHVIIAAIVFTGELCTINGAKPISLVSSDSPIQGPRNCTRVPGCQPARAMLRRRIAEAHARKFIVRLVVPQKTMEAGMNV